MSTDSATIEFLLDQLGRRGASFTTKRMFGEYCLYRDGLPVAFVCDDVLFVKDTLPGREAISALSAPEFGPPYPGAKLYLRLAPDTWDDGAWLRGVLDATGQALPAAKPRTPAKTGARSGKAAQRATGDGAAPGAKRSRATPSTSKRKPPRKPE